MLKSKVLAGLAVMLVGLFFSAVDTSAMGEDGSVVMTISPPRQDIVLVPGETYIVRESMQG